MMSAASTADNATPDMAPKEVVAEYVRQLLCFDESRQRATLDSLASYVAPNLGDGCGGTGSAGPILPDDKAPSAVPPGLELPKEIAGLSTAWSPDAKAPPPVPRVSSGAAKVGQNGGMDSASKLQQATGVLQAALANWEQCLQSESATKQSKGGAPAPALAATRKQVKPNRPAAKSSELETPEDKAALDKALTDLSTSLSPQVAAVTQSLFAAAKEGEASAPHTNESLQALKWLRTHLEKMQEESLGKVMRLLQEQHNPMLEVPPVDPNLAWMQMWPQPLPGPMMMPPLGPVPQMQMPMWPNAPMMPQPFPAVAGMPPGAPWLPQGGVMPPMMRGMPGNQRLMAPPQPRSTRAQHNSRNHNGGANQKPAPATTATGNENNGEEETLRAHLKELKKVDPNRVVLVRKINRLGFESPQILKKHYSQYGIVERVFVAHSHVKPPNRRFAGRLRPSGLGFIVMSAAEEATNILNLGQEQFVGGQVIRVRNFESQHPDAEGEADDDGNQADVSITEEGVSITEEGVSITEEGVSITEEGVSITEEGSEPLQ